MKFPTVLSLFLLQCLLIQAVLGQSRISGQVVDKQQNPIIGANVYLIDTYDGTSTDLKGQFTFQTGEKGTRELVVTYLDLIPRSHQATLATARDKSGGALVDTVVLLDKAVG